MGVSLLGKIVIALINLVCLFLTLNFPNSSTPISVIPVIITVSYWALIESLDSIIQLSISHEKTWKKWFTVNCIFLIIALLFALLCFYFGNSFDITISDQTSEFVFTPKAGYASLITWSNYSTFSYTILVVVIVLSAGEILCGFFHPKKKSAGNTFEDKFLSYLEN